MKPIIEFAALKKCSRQTIYNAIRAGKLKSIYRFGKQLIPETKKNLEWKPAKGKTPKKYKEMK